MIYSKALNASGVSLLQIIMIIHVLPSERLFYVSDLIHTCTCYIFFIYGLNLNPLYWATILLCRPMCLQGDHQTYRSSAKSVIAPKETKIKVHTCLMDIQEDLGLSQQTCVEVTCFDSTEEQAEP